jgi:hypothetical protein
MSGFECVWIALLVGSGTSFFFTNRTGVPERAA